MLDIFCSQTEHPCFVTQTLPNLPVENLEPSLDTPHRLGLETWMFEGPSIESVWAGSSWKSGSSPHTSGPGVGSEGAVLEDHYSLEPELGGAR